ncbi:Serine--tRNA ligase [Escovopsis weberi]|uniref:serine--tRNA ligase n=1 Tax=Escovopsis weberi TaxID=150374 RepID=A0A0M9VTK9_ESCWE|nr:Serine--tRNA ligase [Escovopsis weberi]
MNRSFLRLRRGRNWRRALAPFSPSLSSLPSFSPSSSSSSSSLSPLSQAPAASARTYKRPSTAPKPIIDIKHIRQNVELYEANCEWRNYKRQAGHPARIAQLHAQWQGLQREGRGLRERSNLLRKQLANSATSSGDEDVEELRRMSWERIQEQARAVKAELAGIERQEAQALAEMEALALELPNLTSADTPLGAEPVVLSHINERPRFADEEAAAAAGGEGGRAAEQEGGGGEGEGEGRGNIWRSHVHIGAELGILDFAGAATASGWGWYYLLGEGAQLEQALVQYALAVATRHGWAQVAPPSVVYSHIGAACGFQPRDQHGEQQVYALAQSPADAARGAPELCLAGTAEIPLAGMKSGATLDAAALPLKRAAASRCFRAEAGARGAETKGLYRVHEFTKVELFAWTLPDELPARDVFEEMLDIQTEILSSLGLWCRVLAMPSADLGASAARKVDIEAWFPSREHHSGGWGEVTSASMCLDYQSRRLATRFKQPAAEKPGFPWTCNGTALAVPRVLAALLECGWDEQAGTVTIPECLRPWMDGKEKIGPAPRRY